MKILRFFPVLLIPVILFFSCGRQESGRETKNRSQFEKFISGYPSGYLPSRSPVRIILNKSVTGHRPGSKLNGDILKLKPHVDGKLFLIEPNILEFRPDKPFHSGTKYEVTLSLDKLFEKRTGAGDFHFTFQVMQQDFKVLTGKCVSAGKAEDNLKRYEGKIKTADAMSLEDAQKLLSATSPYGPLTVKVTPAGYNEFSYLIDSIPRKDESYTVTVSWNGNPIGISKKGTLQFEVPSLHDFSLQDVSMDQDNEQTVTLTFSDPVEPSQDLHGLIRIEDVDNLRISVSGSTVFLYPGKRITGKKTLYVEGSVRSSHGVKLGKTKTFPVVFDLLKPQVEIVGNGSITPGPDGLILPFKAVGLRAVDITVFKIFSENIAQFYQVDQRDFSYLNSIRPVGRPVYRKMHRLDNVVGINLKKWNIFSVNLNDLAGDDKGAFYVVKFSFRKEYADYPCSVTTSADLSKYESEDLITDREWQYWDGEKNWYNNWPNDYNWLERDNPCTDSYYINDRFPVRNLIWSNLGVIAKSSDGLRFTVVVTDLLTAMPVPGAKVEFLNFQQQLLSEGNTDENGMLTITTERRPFLLKVSYDGNRSWLRVDDGSSLSVSNFDVSGQEVTDGIKGMIYGDRGVWRPGDTLFLTFVMDDREQQLPSDHPVVLELYNSRGQLAARRVTHHGTDGFYRFVVKTDDDAPTGNWSATVKVGGAVFHKKLKVETIRPNRLKINIDFNRKLLSSNDKGQSGFLKVKWLHGADASGLKAQVNLKLLKSTTGFPGYERYTFDDPTKNYWPFENTVFDGRLDKEGHAQFPLDLQVNKNAPGMLKAVFQTRVFEQGGGFSTDYLTVPFAPYNRFVGLYLPDGGGYDDMLLTDTTHLIRIAAVDKSGHPVSIKSVDVKVYKINWRWWWSSSDDNPASWISGEEAELVFHEQTAIVNGEGTGKFRIRYPEWGRYFILVSDITGGHSAGKTVYVDWPEYVDRRNRTNPSGATLLSFSTDKDTYHPGEMATVSFPSARGARALISLESGSRTITTNWIKCDSAETNYRFEITPDMVPNIYVDLTLLQPWMQTANDRPIRMYGIVPIKVEDPETVLYPQIKVPDEIKPQSEYTVEISEKNGRAMTYTLTVVDEGLLDLTRFQTPDPWKVFFAKEALGVKTWDLFDDVLGAYGGEITKVLAIGGDEEAEATGDRKASRFKPVVTALGPFTLRQGKTAVHRLKMPNYVGSVRVMVVAGKAGAWGSAKAECPVRQAVMVLPTAPRVISPGERMELPVSVFAMKDNVNNVSVSVSVEGGLELQGKPVRKMIFEKPGEQMVYFEILAKETEGTGKINVTAKANDEGASARIELKIENPNPPVTQSETLKLEPGETTDVNCVFFGMKGTNSGTVEVSSFPAFDLDKNLKYLITYPYGCVEQVVSSVFPQLYLDRFAALTDKQAEEVSNNISTAIDRLKRFQLRDGGMSYWPGAHRFSDWGSSYACHFLLLAEQKGYLVPFDMKKKLLIRQNELASAFDVNNSGMQNQYGALMQAYRLYTLALAGQPNIGAMNRLRETPDMPVNAKWRLAAAYLLAGKPEVAGSMVSMDEMDDLPDYRTPGTVFGSKLRDRAMMLETLVLMNDLEDAYSLAMLMIDDMNNRSYMSTQTTAFALYGLFRFASATNNSDKLMFDYAYAGKNEKVNTYSSAYTIELHPAGAAATSLNITNTGKSVLFVTKTMTGQPASGNEISESKNLKMKISYLTPDGKPLDVDTLKQGTDFSAHVTISKAGVTWDYENMALRQIFPSGWEIINERIANVAPAQNESSFIYRDIRDDRVYTFFDMDNTGDVTYIVKLNAAYTGRFYLPAITCEAMYSNNVYARQKGRWVNVVK
jgi:uncharacterized protein YfaS (alpha-2-macroglobulin family)